MDHPTQPTTTPLGVNAMLAQCFDYAGLFPPAKLEMAPMVRNYAAYVAHDDAWMLGRVIVPAARLDEFEIAARQLMPASQEAEPWHVSALVAPAGDERLAGDLERIGAFNAQHGDPASGAAIVDVIELRASSIESIEDALDTIPDDLYPFFELPITTDPRGSITTLVGSDAGAKVRTGGVTPDLYPSAADLARFIVACAGAGVPFKATAGLHHPWRHQNATVGAMEFGFLNVIVATCLAQLERAPAEDLISALEESSIDTLLVDDERITWRDVEFDAAAVQDVRERLFVGLGTCSFDEPRADLRALHHLAP